MRFVLIKNINKKGVEEKMAKTLLKKNGYTLFEYPQFIGTDVPAYSIRYEFEDFETTIYQSSSKDEAIKWFFNLAD